MAMGKTDRSGSQAPLWVAGAGLPRSAGHPFYERLNGILEAGGFDELAESECAQFYAERMGRPSLCPGRYFRLLLVGGLEPVRVIREGGACPSGQSVAERSAPRMSSRLARAQCSAREAFALRDPLGSGMPWLILAGLSRASQEST